MTEAVIWITKKNWQSSAISWADGAQNWPRTQMQMQMQINCRLLIA